MWEPAFKWESAFSAVVAVATVVYAILTGLLARETKRLHEIETEPVVGVFLSLPEPWVPIFQVVIHNFGRGPAQNVKWQVTADMEDLRQRNAEIAAMLAFRVLPYMAPGQEIRFQLGSTFSLLSDSIPTPAKPIHVKVSYENSEGKPRDAEFALDVESFRDTPLGATPPGEKIASALREIAQALRQKSCPQPDLRICL